VKDMEEHGILNIDMVVVNLYQFEKTVAARGHTGRGR
jgi:AICAR transformylase/IMP cyclohydrolase PurH